MSLHFVIDAYNLIRRTCLATKGANQVQSLLDFIIDKKPQGSSNNRVTIVFDGFPPQDFRNNAVGNIQVIFSEDISADERIKKIVLLHSKNKNMIVVTDDREVKDDARLHSVKCIATSEFYKKASPKKKSRIKSQPVSDKFLNYSQMEEINKELRQIWLKKK